MKIDLTRRGERPEHGAHDQLLVARFAAGDVTDAEADAARSLVASCADCRLLASDLLAIAHATADLPNPVRRRDFRLTRERAAELRRPAAINWLSRVIGGEASRRLVPLQRFAVAAVAIGLVMAVVSSPAGIPGFSTGSAALKAAGQASERGAAVPAPGLAVAPNSAAPASAAAFPASSLPGRSRGGTCGAPRQGLSASRCPSRPHQRLPRSWARPRLRWRAARHHLRRLSQPWRQRRRRLRKCRRRQPCRRPAGRSAARLERPNRRR